MPRRSRKPDAAPSTECGGMFCMNTNCPTCWAWLTDATSIESWFKPVDPPQHQTRLIIDLDEPTFDVLQREAVDHKTPIETVATVLLQEAAAEIAVGKAGRSLAGGHLPSDLEGRSKGRHR